MACSPREILDQDAARVEEARGPENRMRKPASLDEAFDRRLAGENRERMAKLEGSLEGFLAGRRDRDAA
ncbi:MAG: hypothetical protein OXF98_08360 [Rhodospirillaceae bacterium]|nr:hypothetical protein [Rhodospirillaceae bacterium]